MKEVENKEIKPLKQSVKGGGRIRGLIVALVILILASTVIFAGFKFLKARDPSAAAEGKKGSQKAKADNVGPVLSLDPFIVNLADNNENKYLKITIEMELEKEEVLRELEKRSGQIRDTILTLLTSKTFDEIKDVPGKFKLREQIAKRINTLLNSGKIRQVYFTEFVIQ